MLATSDERRRYPRLDSRIPVRYRRIGTKPQGFKLSLIKNISKGGFMMSIYEFLPLNLKLATVMSLESGTQPVRGTCRVAWVAKRGYEERYDVGLEFVHLNEGDAAQIADFVK